MIKTKVIPPKRLRPGGLQRKRLERLRWRWRVGGGEGKGRGIPIGLCRDGVEEEGGEGGEGWGGVVER